MNKKTSQALLNSGLTKVSIESIINHVGININNINYDSGTGTLGTSPTFEGKLEEITFASGELPSYVLKSDSEHTNNNAWENLNNGTTKSLFKFQHNGTEFGTGSGLTAFKKGPVNEDEDIEWQLITATGTEDDAKVGDKGYRYAFMILDQTGKIDPNFAVGSVLDNGNVWDNPTFDKIGHGLGYEVYNSPALTDMSTPYDMVTMVPSHPQYVSKFFVENSFSDLNNLYNSIESNFDHGNYAKELFTFVRDEDNVKYVETSKKLLSTYLYPYSDEIVYAEKKGLFNLNSINSNTKIEDIYNNIPYLKNMPSKVYIDPSTPGYTYTPTAQREQVTASLKDYIDDDILATTNYTNLDWSIEDWIKNTGDKPYCGFEGFSLESLTIAPQRLFNAKPNATNVGEPHLTITDNSKSPYHWSGYGAEWGRDFQFSRTHFEVWPRIISRYDLNGTTLSSLTNGGRLMLYFEYETTAKVMKHDHNLTDDPATSVDERVSLYAAEHKLKREVVSRLPDISSLETHVTNIDATEYGMKPGFNYDWMHRLANGRQAWEYDRGIQTYFFSPHVDEGGPGPEVNIFYSVSEYTIKFTKPMILFLDDDDYNAVNDPTSASYNPTATNTGHCRPELDEIVQVFFLPSPSKKGVDPIVSANADNSTLIAINTVDPRLGHLPSSYTLLENYTGSGWCKDVGNELWWARRDLARTPTWDLWQTTDSSHSNYNSHTNWLFGGKTGFPQKEDVQFSFPRYDAEMIKNSSTATNETNATDQTLIYEKANYEGITGLKTISSLHMPVQKNSSGTITGFGGMTNLAELGKISRGEAWRSFNLSQFNMKLYKARIEGKNQSVLEGLYKYASLYDDPIDSSKVYPFNLKEPSSYNDNFTKNLTVDDLNGGDAAILDQVILAVDNDGSKITTQFVDLPERTVHGVYNPNTTYPYTIKALLGGIRIPRKEDQTRAYNHTLNTENQSLLPWKLGAVASSFNKDIKNALQNKIAPFSRKYSYSYLADPSGVDKNPGDPGYVENFNLEYDKTTKSFKHTDIRTGNIRYSNVFAKSDLHMLTDIEREYLYVNSREFISTRFNYYSAIILIEPLTVVPGGTVAGNPNSGKTSIRGLSNSKNLQANIHGHYRVRAEISHDTLTNTVKILDYKILN